MGRAIDMENNIQKLTNEFESLKQRIDLVERAIEAGRKPIPKVKKETKKEVKVGNKKTN